MAKSLKASKPKSLPANQTYKSVKIKEYLVFSLAAGAVPALAESTKNFSVVR